MREYKWSKSVLLALLVILFPIIFFFTESDGCLDLGGVWNWRTLSCEDKGTSQFVVFTQRAFQHQLFSVCIVGIIDIVLSCAILFPVALLLMQLKGNGDKNKNS